MTPEPSAEQEVEFVGKLAEILADDEQNDKVRIRHLKLAQRILRWLQAEGLLVKEGEQLTAEEAQAILVELPQYSDASLAVGEEFDYEVHAAARDSALAKLDGLASGENPG